MRRVRASKKALTWNGVTYKSKLELHVAYQLYDNGIHIKYEDMTYEYWDTFPNAQCMDCYGGNVAQLRTYTPDWYRKGIVLEAKGILDVKNRKKLIAVQEENPQLDIRLIFDKDNWITKAHKTRYSQWATKNGFMYCIREIPFSWLEDLK